MKVEIGQVVKRSRARSTGEIIVVVYHDKNKWAARSLHTGAEHVFPTRRAAEIAMSKPETWNPVSKEIVDGKLPKYTKEHEIAPEEV